MEKKSAITIASSLMFALWIVIIKTVDVAKVDPLKKEIGLYHVNQRIHAFFGINMMWYDITEVLGFLAIGVAGIFALIGLVQLIKRKNILAVDREILALGGLFAVVIVLYVFFDKVPINYRPIFTPGTRELEASFPSSHTMLICTVMGGVIIILNKYIKNEMIANLIKVVCCILILVTVCGRLVCGVHWFTDIVGGVILSVALLGAFAIVVERVKE